MRKFTEHFLITKTIEELISENTTFYDHNGKVIKPSLKYKNILDLELSFEQGESFDINDQKYQIIMAYHNNSNFGFIIVDKNNNKKLFECGGYNEPIINEEKGYVLQEDGENIFVYFIEDDTLYVH